MRRSHAAALGAPLALSLATAILLSLLQLALVFALGLLLRRYRIEAPAAKALWLGLPLALLAFNTWALNKALRARHLLGLFGAWPGLPEEEDADPARRQAAQAARRHFDAAEFGRALALLDRLGPGGSRECLRASGRCLAMLGRFGEALDRFKAAGDAETLRWLGPRRRFGVGLGPYFGPGDLAWSRRPALLALLGLLSLALGGGWLGAGSRALRLAREAQEPAQLAKGMLSEVRGRFTFHYHRRDLLDTTAELAEKALDQQLAFLGLPEGAFGPGAIRAYLCESHEEYLARFPGAKPWEAGAANPKTGEVFLYRLPPNQRIAYEAVVAHEVCHLSFHRLVPNSSYDAWLTEGFSEYMGFRFALGRAGWPLQAWLAEHMFKDLKKKTMPFSAFLADSPRGMPDDALDDIRLFYLQGFSVVFVLIEHYGRDAFLGLLRQVRGGLPIGEALPRAYPTIRSAADLKAVWSLFI